MLKIKQEEEEEVTGKDFRTSKIQNTRAVIVKRKWTISLVYLRLILIALLLLFIIKNLMVNNTKKLHDKLLYLPTRREKKMKTRNTQTMCHERAHMDDNVACTEQFGQSEDQGDTREEQQQQQKKRKIWNKKLLIVRYTYESGPLLNLKQEFRQLWTKSHVYSGSIMKNVRAIMTAASNPSLDDLLVRKKPPRDCY